MDLPPLNVNKFQASVDIIRYCEWPKIKKYMNKRIVKAVNECKTQATIAKKFVGQIEKKKWSLKKRSSSKGELEEKYDFDEDDISWGSDFDEDDLDEDDVVANGEFTIDEKRYAPHNGALVDDCRAGHYDLSQLNEKLTTGEQLLNVGRFERIGTPPNSSLTLDDEEIVSNLSNHYALHRHHHHHHSNSIKATNGLLEGKTLTADGNNSDGGCTASISSSGVSSVCGTGSNDVSPSSSSSYASACCSSSCNSSAADSTCSQSPPPLSTSSSTTSSSAKLACKLLAKLLTNASNGHIDNEHLSTKNLQLKLQLNEQLNKQFAKINEQNIRDQQISQTTNYDCQNMSHNNSSSTTNNMGKTNKFNNQINQEHYSLANKSNSMSVINHNNNYLKNVDQYRPVSDLKSSLVNKSMINLNQYNQLNDYHFKVNENNLNDEIIAVKTYHHSQLGSPKLKLNNSTSNLSTFKSNTKSDSTLTCTINRNKNSIVARQIEQLEQLNENHSSASTATATNSNLFKNQDNDDGLSSGSSSILSTFKYNGSEKSYVTAKDSSGSSCSSSIRSVSLKQLNKPVVPPKPIINNAMKEDRNNRKKPSSKVIRPSIEPPLPPMFQQAAAHPSLMKETNCALLKEQKSTLLKTEVEESTRASTDSTKDHINLTTATKDKSPYSSSHSLNDLIISEFTIEEVNEILNCKLSDDDEFLNDTNYTAKLLQQQFSHHQTKSLQHLNELEKEEQVKTIENGLKASVDVGNQQNELISKNQAELNEKLLLTKNDLINNLNSLDKECKQPDKRTESNLKSKFDYKFTNRIDSKLDEECLSEGAIFNLRKTGNQRPTKLGNLNDDVHGDYEKPICKAGNELATRSDLKDNENDCYLTTISASSDTLIEKAAISPPPEFNDDPKDLHELNKQTNDELKNQLKRQINLNKHLQSRWSSVDLVQQHQQSLGGRLSNHHHQSITPSPPPISFSGSAASSNKLNSNHSSMLALPNRPKLPTTSKNFLNATNKLTNARKIVPNKLKSLPEIFTSKLSPASGCQKTVTTTTKLIEDKLNNTFSSTSLVSQIKTQQQQSSSSQINQLAIRPLPPLPLEHYSWYHNLEREEATSLLTKLGKEGGYLVRTSKRAGSNSPYSLSIYHNGKCFNLNIRKRDDGMYALGKEKDKEKIFQSIPQLIEYHQAEAILLTTKGQNAGSTKLMATPCKF